MGLVGCSHVLNVDWFSGTAALSIRQFIGAFFGTSLLLVRESYFFCLLLCGLLSGEGLGDALGGVRLHLPGEGLAHRLECSESFLVFRNEPSDGRALVSSLFDSPALATFVMIALVIKAIVAEEMATGIYNNRSISDAATNSALPVPL